MPALILQNRRTPLFGRPLIAIACDTINAPTKTLEAQTNGTSLSPFMRIAYPLGFGLSRVRLQHHRTDALEANNHQWFVLPIHTSHLAHATQGVNERVIPDKSDFFALPPCAIREYQQKKNHAVMRGSRNTSSASGCGLSRHVPWKMILTNVPNVAFVRATSAQWAHDTSEQTGPIVWVQMVAFSTQDTRANA